MKNIKPLEMLNANWLENTEKWNMRELREMKILNAPETLNEKLGYLTPLKAKRIKIKERQKKLMYDFLGGIK